MVFRRRIEANLEKITEVIEIQPHTKCERATTATTEEWMPTIVSSSD
jgi:hypothetical protein